MFREMRRKKQELSLEENIEILNKKTSGVLAVLGEEGYPYTIPLNYVYYDSKIYFHGAKSGHKIDSIKKYDKVSFCVVDYEQIVPEKYTAYFRSVVVFGKIQIIEEEKEMRKAIEQLAAKYSPQHEKERLKGIEKEWERLCMLELSIEHMTGKEAIN